MKNTDTILIIDDDELDRQSVLRAIKDLKIPNPVVTAKNGIEAISVLKALDIRKLGLIITDFNMPEMSGVEFVRWKQTQMGLSMIPVVVMTTSIDPKDLFDAYSSGISGYVQKTDNYTKFVEIVRTIYQYWCVCVLPPEKSVFEMRRDS